jgi:hypothetical protein
VAGHLGRGPVVTGSDSACAHLVGDQVIGRRIDGTDVDKHTFFSFRFTSGRFGREDGNCR